MIYRRQVTCTLYCEPSDRTWRYYYNKAIISELMINWFITFSHYITLNVKSDDLSGIVFDLIFLLQFCFVDKAKSNKEFKLLRNINEFFDNQRYRMCVLKRFVCLFWVVLYEMFTMRSRFLKLRRALKYIPCFYRIPSANAIILCSCLTLSKKRFNVK